jgi:GDP-L-fucose synthase
MNKKSRIYVAGHAGFLGSAVVRKLNSLGYNNLILRTHRELDLTDQARVNRLFKALRPEYVFLFAAKVGGIQANNTFPADFIYENLAIQSNVMSGAQAYGVKKLLFPGSACMYPKYCSQPIKEEYLLAGPIESTSEPFAVAKIAGVRMCQAYNKQYKTNFISVVPATIYGPGDHFDENGHVVSGLIQKFHAGCKGHDKAVKVWGSGKPRREFLYIDDAADACVFLMDHYNGTGLINIGSGQEVSVKKLVEMIKALFGFNGATIFQKNKPDGMPRRLLDSSKIYDLGWRPRFSLDKGLRLTCEWIKREECAF